MPKCLLTLPSINTSTLLKRVEDTADNHTLAIKHKVWTGRCQALITTRPLLLCFGKLLHALLINRSDLSNNIWFLEIKHRGRKGGTLGLHCVDRAEWFRRANIPTRAASESLRIKTTTDIYLSSSGLLTRVCWKARYCLRNKIQFLVRFATWVDNHNPGSIYHI